MKLKGPIITLLAGALLAGGLLVVNLQSNSDGDPADVAAAATPGATTSAPATAPATTAPATAAPATTAPAVTKLVNATWAGRVKGGAATVAIVARQGVAIAYVCDGESIEAWLKGTAENGKLVLSGKGKSRLIGTFGNGRAAGAVWAANDTRWTFDVPVAKKPSGLYRSTSQVRSATVDAGWIVLPDGTQVGVFTTDGRDPEPAPKLDTASGTAEVDGAELDATPIDPDTGTGFRV
jgi:serine/threonine-protein kinase